MEKGAVKAVGKEGDQESNEGARRKEGDDQEGKGGAGGKEGRKE